jgi:cell division protein FtsN
MEFSKKGQGLSLNVIIIAALALIVLVVLVVIFTSSSADFEKKVSQETRTELIKLRLGYGTCEPLPSREETFAAEFNTAETVDDKERARSAFKGEIDRCKALSNTERGTCESASCTWD